MLKTSRKESAGGRRFSISLSDRSVKAFNHLKEATDVDTDTEVFRNALRIHAMLLAAHEAGKQIYIQDGENKTILPITLFADVLSLREKDTDLEP